MSEKDELENPAEIELDIVDEYLDNQIESFEIQSDDTKPILKNDNGKITFYLISSLIIACIGSGFQFGWNVALLNNPSESVKEFFREIYKTNTGQNMSNSTLNAYWAITNGLFPLGGTFGSIFPSTIADNIGRKNGLLVVNFIMIASAILGFICKYVNSYHVLMVSRLLCGLYCGISSTILPIYLSECSSNNFRGWTGTLIHLSVAVGAMSAMVLGLPTILGSTNLWHFLIGLSIIPALVQCFLFFYSETPKYVYVFQKDKLATEIVLLKLRGGDSAEVKFEMKELEDENKALEFIPTWKSFWSQKVLFRATTVAVMIQIAQQLTGINTFTFYSTQIFLSAGLSLNEATLVTMIASIVDLSFCLISMNLVDSAGRKPLLMWSAIGMFFSALFITISRILITDMNRWIGYLGVLAYVSYQIFFSIGLGPIPKYITAELYASTARGKGSTISFFFHWLFVFLVVVFFPLIDSVIGFYSTLIFTICLIFIVLYVIFFVPETKNKPIDRIVADFNERYIFYRK